MTTMTASDTIRDWPEPSREAAQLVIDQHGEPHETTPSLLLWYDVGPWKRLTASRGFYEHHFPVPHIDSVESVIDYQVPPEKLTALGEFDGSVAVERTAGEVLARCHDEQANFLALNLMHDIVTGARTVAQARDHYAQVFLDYRRKEPTPDFQQLRFSPGGDTADPDERALSGQDLQRAAEEGTQKQ